MRMLVVEFDDDISCSISRAVFADDDFIVEVDLLHQRALDRLPNEALVVIGDDQDADFHGQPPSTLGTGTMKPSRRLHRECLERPMTPAGDWEDAALNAREFWGKDGYYVARGLLEPATTAQVLADFALIFTQKLRQLELPVDDGDGNSLLRNNMRTLLEHDTGIYVSALRLASRLRSVYALTMHSRILERLEQLGMTTLSVTGAVAVHVVSDELRIPGGYMGWRPHQDWAAGQGSLKLVTVWAPLMDIPSDFYPLKLIPASHLMGVWKGDRDKQVTRGGLIEIDSEQYRGAEWLSH